MPKKKLDTGIQSNNNLDNNNTNNNNLEENNNNDIIIIVDDKSIKESHINDNELIQLNGDLPTIKNQQTQKKPLITTETLEIKNNIIHRVSTNTTSAKKQIQKPGKTLLIKLINNMETFDMTLLDNINGLVNKTNITPKKTLFITFDSIDNSMKAYYKLYSYAYKNNYIVRYSYYKIFFTITGLTNETVYTDTKKKLIEYINTKTNTNILYCKFYCKNNTYLGCGELTVDTMEGLNIILSDAFKKFEFDTFTGNFYKYNKK